MTRRPEPNVTTPPGGGTAPPDPFPSSALDRSAPLPLWAQLERALRDRVSSGNFDARFPTDGELMAEYSVSRQTVREAMRRLQADGVVERGRGRRPRVDRAAIEQPVGALYSLFSTVEAQGRRQGSRVLTLALCQDGAAAGRLGLGPSDDLLHLERLRLVDDEPLAIDRVWLPAGRAMPLLDADWSHTALYDELERRCGFRPDSGWERIRPAIPSASERRLLHLGRSDAVFAIERLGTVGIVPVEWRQSLVRGDTWAFVADWSGMARAAPLRLSAIDTGTGSA